MRMHVFFAALLATTLLPQPTEAFAVVTAALVLRLLRLFNVIPRFSRDTLGLDYGELVGNDIADTNGIMSMEDVCALVRSASNNIDKQVLDELFDYMDSNDEQQSKIFLNSVARIYAHCLSGPTDDLEERSMTKPLSMDRLCLSMPWLEICSSW